MEMCEQVHKGNYECKREVGASVSKAGMGQIPENGG